MRIIAYGCTTGVRSSRNLAKACVENVAFRYLARGNQPKKSAICDFHNRHRDELVGVLVQVVQIAQALGLIDTEAIAIDGTKMAGSASLEANQAYEELVAEQAAIEASIEAWFAEIDEADAQATEGSVREDQLPPGLQGRKERLERVREAKDQLEELGRERAKEQEEKWEAYRAREPRRGRPPLKPDHHPPEGAQRNVTDPESRVMKRGSSWVQGFNAQAAVSSSGLVVAGAVTNEAHDQARLAPMVDRAEEALGSSPERVAVDGGYWSPDQIEQVAEEVAVFFPAKRPGRPPDGEGSGSPAEAVWERFKERAKTVNGRAMQVFRRGVVEPVFGDVRENKGVVRFFRRGLAGVGVEWAMVLVGVNLRRMFSMVRG